RGRPVRPARLGGAGGGAAARGRRGAGLTTGRPVVEVIRVLLVDDHAVVRRGLRAFVEIEPALEVVGEAGDGQEALDLLREWHTLGRPLPHVVLMDLRMPRMDGTEATGRMTAGYPDVRVVILTSFGEAERV